MSIEKTVVIEKLSHDCRGLVKIDNKITFIEEALANEEVSFQYLKKKKDWDEARVLEVLKKSKDRVEPKCQFFSLCGGCDIQHMNHKSQLAIKEEVLLDLFLRIAKVKPLEVLEPITSEPWHYRHKARLSVRYVHKKSTCLIGFREKSKPQFIADIISCEILHEKVSKALPKLRELCNSWSKPQSIAQIEVAAGDHNEVALIFRHLEDLAAEDLKNLEDFSIAYGFRIYGQSGGPNTVKLLFPENAGNYLQYSLPQYELSFNFFPTDFTQINLAVNRKMVAKALELLAIKPTDTVLDMFCGIGNFTLAIARFAKTVIGVELSADMVKRAKYNAEYNKIDNIIFQVADLSEVWPQVSSYKIDKLLIDPPRTGALEVVNQIEKISPKIIVYISCNAATLARDAAILISKGYRLSKTLLIDMFPQTIHIESLSLFEKLGA